MRFVRLVVMRNSQTVVVMTKYFLFSFFSLSFGLIFESLFNKSVFFIIFLFSNKTYTSGKEI